MMAETLVGVSPTEPQMQDPHELDMDVSADSDAVVSAPKEDLAARQRLSARRGKTASR